ncbi:hypothetical protein CAMRE0001_3181 [Campylobacter rectus RM3267]|uniref:Uncharacterized protein n=1 Tax=Campylobacter rectus RM3267 TaxID=553218 RepID=B9D195_CAMRE|nr:hypothetical protein CAMRE0001_3181 [Campylobacter rectus RM3267]
MSRKFRSNTRRRLQILRRRPKNPSVKFGLKFDGKAEPTFYKNFRPKFRTRIHTNSLFSEPS